ncbi:MAG: hypothetical protein V4642_01370 [Bacteroidota bacterium]
MLRFLLYIFLCSCLLYSGCTGGLDPTNAPTVSKISGTVTFVGGPDAWPPADSLIDLRVAAFKKYPPETVKGDAEQRLNYRVQSQNYSLEIGSVPVEFPYIVVMQQFANDVDKDWRVIGVYTSSGDVNFPSAVKIDEGQIFSNIDIIVNFSNLPPNPF